jgi:hypothetical protein
MSSAATTLPPLIRRAPRTNLRLVKEPSTSTSTLPDDGSSTEVASVAAGPVVTKRELVSHAINSVAAISVADGELDVETAMAALLLIHHLVVDNSATPQISPGAEGGVMVEWRVKGRSLNIQVLSEADIYAWAEDQDGTERFQYELTSKWTPSDEPILAMNNFLAALSKDVSDRVTIKRLP